MNKAKKFIMLALVCVMLFGSTLAVQAGITKSGTSTKTGYDSSTGVTYSLKATYSFTYDDKTCISAKNLSNGSGSVTGPSGSMYSIRYKEVTASGDSTTKATLTFKYDLLNPNGSVNKTLTYTINCDQNGNISAS